MDDHTETSTTPRRSGLEKAVVAAALAIAVIGIVVRFIGLSRQSYWSDEMFSVTQASSSFKGMAHMGSTEVHPPLFAFLAWVWQHLGHSVRPRWMRLFPAVCGALSVLTAWLELRRMTLSTMERALLAAATSVSGMAIVYSQEMRSYSLLFLASVGVTAASLALLVPVHDRRALVMWTLWGALASATHLFGAFLVAACATCIWFSTGRRDTRRLATALLVAELPQIAWLVHGALTPGFSQGADWIARPGASDVWALLTSIFAAGHLRMSTDGFRLTSPWGVAAVLLALVGAFALSQLRGSRVQHPTESDAAVSRTSPEHPHQTSESGTHAAQFSESSAHASRATGVALRFLLALAVGLLAVMFLVSQVVHLWTLRNMIVVAPAFLWASILGVLLLARTVTGQRVMAAVMVLLLAAGLAGVSSALRSPYKGELSQSMNRAAELRRQFPDMQVYQSRTSYWWLYSSRLQPTAREYRTVMTPSSTLAARSRYGADVPRAARSVPTLYILYTSASQSSGVVNDRILAHNRAGCHAEPFQYVAFVFCQPVTH